jgi:hypothetical protein
MAHKQYVATVETTNEAVVMSSNQTDVRLEFGEIRDVGHTAYIRSTYAARYNFAAKLYNQYDTDGTNKKRYMRGGRFFLYNFILIVLIIASIISIINISNDKATGAVPIIVSIIYLLITCYNWHIHRTNGSLIHDHMIRIQDRYLTNSINEHFRIPVHARIQNRQLIAASDGTTTAVLTRLQQQNHNLTDIDIMVYGSTYANKYAGFPTETIIHFIAFTILLIVAISRMS